MATVMIDFAKAKELAFKKLEEIQGKSVIRLTLLESETVTFKYGWVFFYQSEEFVRTGDESQMVGGNAPFIVDKYTGMVIMAGTSKDVQHYIEIFTKFRDEWYL